MTSTTLDSHVIARAKAREVSEWWFVAATIVAVLAVTSLPYVYAYATTPPDKQFMGVMLDVPDHGQYFSWMRELTTANLASNKLTPEANRPIFFNLLWWGMGRLGKLVGWGYAEMFQVLRFVAGTLFLLLAYRVCGWFLPERRMRRAAFLVIALGSGLGWILIVLKYTLMHGETPFPLDVFIAEGNTFLGILGYPHFIGAALYIFVFDVILRGQAKGQLRYAVAAGLFAQFLGWQHAYDLVSVYGVLFAYAVLLTLRDRRLPLYMIESGVIVGLLSGWPALYSFALTSLDPIWKQVLAQFANAGVYTPNLLHLPILLGIPLLLAVFAVVKQNPLRLREKDDKALFVLAWFLITFALVYLPVDFQIHLINGWQVPIAILAVQGLFQFVVPWVQAWASSRRWTWSKEAFERGVAIALIVAILPTNLYLWTWRFVDLQRHGYPYYLYQDEIQASKWLEANAQPDDVVLSSLTVGQYLPALTGTRAFLAHWAQTLRFYEKSEQVTQFYGGGMTDAQRQALLRQYGVEWVFYGPAERELAGTGGQVATPAQMPFLRQVFSSPLVQIYRVQ